MKKIIKRLAATSIFFYPTTQQEIQDAISKMKPKNTNDVYDISTKLVKLGSKSISKILVHIFNHSLRHGIFPEKLKIAYIIPIHKGESKTCLNNYRPISILPDFSKLLEKIVYIHKTTEIFNS